MFEEWSSSLPVGLAGNIHPSSLHSVVGVLRLWGYMQNSLKDTARKKKLDLTSVCRSMTLGHNSDRCKQALLVCNFQGRARGEYFSSRLRNHRRPGVCQNEKENRHCCCYTLSNQPELSVQLWSPHMPWRKIPTLALQTGAPVCAGGFMHWLCVRIQPCRICNQYFYSLLRISSQNVFWPHHIALGNITEVSYSLLGETGVPHWCQWAGYKCLWLQIRVKRKLAEKTALRVFSPPFFATVRLHLAVLWFILILITTSLSFVTF